MDREGAEFEKSRVKSLKYKKCLGSLRKTAVSIAMNFVELFCIPRWIWVLLGWK
jgi:hypothetical protein